MHVGHLVSHRCMLVGARDQRGVEQPPRIPQSCFMPRAWQKWSPVALVRTRGDDACFILSFRWTIATAFRAVLADLIGKTSD